MWTAKWILDAYEVGNEADRLELYLVYRDLRLYFDEIEARPEMPDKPEAVSAAGELGATWWQNCCRLVRG